MTELLVVNEASLPFVSLDDCSKNIDNIFDILHLARLGNLSFCRVDGYEGEWGELNYADGFEFGRWLNNIVDQDKIRQIKSVLTNVRCPLINTENTQNNQEYQNFIYFLESNDLLDLLGLGQAYILDKYSFSFASDKVWLDDVISIIEMSDFEGDSKVETVTVKNIASKQQLLAYLEELEQRRKENKEFLGCLKTKNNEDFPNLLFSESVLKSFRSNSIQADELYRIIDVLEKLNAAIVFSTNITTLSEQSSLSITGESSSTMSNKVLVRLRTFKHPDNGKLVFEDHVKNFPNAKRMHIWPDYQNNKVCIGYFGAHLKTSSS